MELFIGGAYMGKRTFVQKRYSISEEEIWDCEIPTAPAAHKSCITHLESMVWDMIRDGTDVVDWFQKNRDWWEDSMLICRDISSGIVPLEPEDRKWREETGKLLQYLAEEAKHVYRVFCGLGVQIK